VATATERNTQPTSTGLIMLTVNDSSTLRRHARGFFEALIADNLDLGRPHNVEIIFNRRIRRDTPSTFRTAATMCLGRAEVSRVRPSECGLIDLFAEDVAVTCVLANSSIMASRVHLMLTLH
jgi:hypothetical protein